MKILVVGRTLERSVTLLYEIFRENLGQVDLRRSCNNRTLHFKDGTTFIATSVGILSKEMRGSQVDQIFFEEGCLTGVNSYKNLFYMLYRSQVPKEFQFIELKNDYTVIDTTLAD